MNRTRAAAAALTVAALLGLAACGTDGPAADPKPAANDAAGTGEATEKADPQAEAEAALVEAVKTYTHDLFTGDRDGYDYLSERCKKSMDTATWARMANSAHHTYGTQEATNVKVDDLAGDLARVSYGAGNIPQFDREKQAWAREDGGWKWDACPSTGADTPLDTP